MTRRATIALAGMCVSVGALGAPPAKYYHDDTAAMVRLDLASITVENVKAAVNALVTQADLDAAGVAVNLELDVMPQVNQIGMAQMMTMGLTSNGGNVVNIVLTPPAGGMGGEPTVTLLMAASSAEGAQKLLGAVQGLAGMVPGGFDTGTELSGDEHWVVASPPGAAPVEGEGSPARRDALTGALESVGQNTMSVGFVPSQKMIASVLENVDDEQGQAMVTTMMKAEWMGVWLSVDETPEFGVRMKYADSELAGQVEELYAGAMEFMVAQAREGDAQVEDVPAEFTPGAIAEKLREWLSMEREGEICTVKLDPGEMRQLALLSIKAGPMLEQVPMFAEFMKEFRSNVPAMN